MLIHQVEEQTFGQQGGRQRRTRRALVTGLAVLATSAALSGPGALQAVGSPAADPATASPIKHVVIIIGENHSFDNVFATYQPTQGQTVRNLLSEGIVRTSGAFGPHVSNAQQQTACVGLNTSTSPATPCPTTTYSLTPTLTGPYPSLPQPDTTYASKACTGQSSFSPDGRFPANLSNGPFQITQYVPYADNHSQYAAYGTCEFYGAFVGDPIHRFYQMWQQVNQGTNQLFPWVANTAGDDNGASPPAPIHQGALSMGYYNMATGDAPIFRFLADHFAMSDNYHQSVMGGTGANHIMLGTGDAAYYQDSAGNPTVPPSNQIENPNPKPNTNNNYTQDGYAGGSYSNCSDRSQPGVGAIFDYLSSLHYATFRNGDCAPSAYYILNNYLPGYNVDGTKTAGTFVVPPQSFPTIADELSARHISWGYFGEGYNNGSPTSAYCPICDPFQYATSVMTDPAKRKNIQHDSTDFDSDVAKGSIPAVSFLKPGDDDGHPGYSTLYAFENFVDRTVLEIMNQPKLWQNTAIMVTFDESGGYYDSGYVQPVSFFGDGSRVPLLVISPYTQPGHVDHIYADHVSLLKFIERNWGLTPISTRSEDNLPDPTRSVGGGYVPVNAPAIGDLFSLFDFANPQLAPPALPAPATVRVSGAASATSPLLNH